MTLTVFDERELVEYMTAQRWFGGKSRDVTGAQTIDVVSLPGDAGLALALIEIRFETGVHDNYQLLTTERHGRLELDALGDPSLAVELVHLMRSGAEAQGASGLVRFGSLPRFASATRGIGSTRRIDAEQSNTSLVFDENLIFKVYRRLEAGTNPELELLYFLSRRGFAHTPELGGWYEYAGRPMEATLGILQTFVSDGLDGFDLALDELASDPERFIGRLGRLGQVTAAMHTVLGSEHEDPAFSTEEPSAESLGLLTATIDEEIERIFGSLPADDERLVPIARRKEDVRERLTALARIGGIGRIIRHHGDYHLGQALWAGEDWTIIDFEGEPARPIAERRRKRSPLRDVAGMLRSFAYAASAASILRGVDAPAGWEERAREEFLAGYLATVDTSLLPSGRQAIGRLLSIFELEKAVYELRYELDHRPDWVSIPVAGIERLLEGDAFD